MKARIVPSLVVAMALLTVVIGFAGLASGAIWPSLCALILVFATHNVLMGLFGGAVAGAYLIADGRFWTVPLQLVEDHLLPHFSSPWKTGAIIFTLLLGGFVHLLFHRGKNTRIRMADV